MKSLHKCALVLYRPTGTRLRLVWQEIPRHLSSLKWIPDLAETELERAEKRYAQAKARLQALRNREATRQRKLDTRRKVILGGALLDLSERDTGAAAMVERLIRNLSRDQDRKAFAEWDGAGSGVDGAPAAGEGGSPALPPDPDGTG